jgi:hypothetical protein
VENLQSLGCYFLCACPPKIFIERKQWVRFEFAKGLAQFLLNAVNLMKESAALHFELATAELPVRPEEEVELENFVLGFIQKTLADQTKIRDVFLVPPAPNLAPVLPADNLKASLADMPFLLVAKSESGIAEPEYFPQCTFTGGL